MTASNLTQERKVMLAGATGLIGGYLLQYLLANTEVSAVHALSRRDLKVNHPKLVTHLVDFAHLPTLPQVDEVYLALGTTIKVAGSQAAFRAVDLQANLAVAKAAMASGARRVGLVSAAGANPQARSFYTRVKGELERALEALPLDALVIARPSLLLDSRDGLGQPPRIGETIAIPIAKLIAPLLPGAYRPVHAKAVARALVQTVPRSQGLKVLASDSIAELGQG